MSYSSEVVEEMSHHIKSAEGQHRLALAGPGGHTTTQHSSHPIDENMGFIYL